MKILMVLTSHDLLGTTGKKTGFWLEEFAAPYYTFKDAGAQVTVASPKGGQPPIDPKSNEADNQTAATIRLQSDSRTQAALATTKILGQLKVADYDAVFYAGGHGPLWDLVEDKDSIALIQAFYAAGKPVSAVCHAPGVFRFVRKADNTPLVKGRKVTGFANSEEEAVHLTNVVPFLVEDMLKEEGAKYSKNDDWKPYVVVDGNLITGQNPASSEKVANVVLEMLEAS